MRKKPRRTEVRLSPLALRKLDALARTYARPRSYIVEQLLRAAGRTLP